MRILVLAPHPYYVVRGTPIDLDLVLRVLAQREGTEVDVVVYPAGEERQHPNVRIHRAAGAWLARDLGPGFSLRKVLLDLLLGLRAWRLLRRARYDVIHADEEAVYLALVFGRLWRIPYVYDLDSSVAQQLVEKMPWLRPGARLLDRCEQRAVRRAAMVLPVCDLLAERCRDLGARKVLPIYDISQLDAPGAPQTGELKRELGIEGLVVLYAGNLEPYQGVELLVRGLAQGCARGADLHLVIVGGATDEIAASRKLARRLAIPDRVHHLGRQPFEKLGWFLAEADIVASPRIRGVNTPMKVFAYLHSGRALLATRLPTHTQILTPEVAMLVDPIAEGVARGLLELARSPELRRSLGARGRAFVEANHTFAAHRRRLDAAYDWLEAQLRTA